MNIFLNFQDGFFTVHIVDLLNRNVGQMHLIFIFFQKSVSVKFSKPFFKTTLNIRIATSFTAEQFVGKQ
jgi:hypothetical protein